LNVILEVEKDYNKAIEWYLKSAINGCAEGQNGQNGNDLFHK